MNPICIHNCVQKYTSVYLLLSTNLFAFVFRVLPYNLIIIPMLQPTKDYHVLPAILSFKLPCPTNYISCPTNNYLDQPNCLVLQTTLSYQLPCPTIYLALQTTLSYQLHCLQATYLPTPTNLSYKLPRPTDYLVLPTILSYQLHCPTNYLVPPTI